MRPLQSKVRVKGYGWGMIISRAYDEPVRYNVRLDRDDMLMLKNKTESDFMPEAQSHYAGNGWAMPVLVK